MTDNKKYNDINLDRLLELGETTPKMPEDLKDRIRSRLIQMEPESDRKTIFPFRWVALPLAATAALVLFILFPWLGNFSGSITWADVQKQLDNIHTFEAKVDAINLTNGENRLIYRTRVYYKDPGLARYDYPGLDATSPPLKAINIMKRKSGLSEQLTLHADSRQVEWRTQIYRTIGPENPPSLLIDQASYNWSIMKKLTESNTKFIGYRIINGLRAAGFSFECPAREIIRLPDVTGQAYGKIFVKSEDSVPIYHEFEYTTRRGEKIKWEISDMKWNEPLEESLFDFSVPKGWHLEHTSIETAEYTDTKLAPGINMYVGLDGMVPMITSDDVIGVLKVEKDTKQNSKIPGSMNINIEIKQSALQRLQKQETTHPEAIIVVDFNGQTKVPIILDNNFPERLTFDLSRLGYSISEIEKKYFTKTTTIYKGDE